MRPKISCDSNSELPRETPGGRKDEIDPKKVSPGFPIESDGGAQAGGSDAQASGEGEGAG